MRILVVGATGVVGRQLVPMLVNAGHAVIATTTTSSKTGGLASAGAEPLVLDVLDTAATEAALVTARPETVVYQATALSSLGTNMRRFDRSFAMTNRLRNVVLRYGGLYGPGTSLDRHGPQTEAIRRRLMPIVGDGGGTVSYLHVEDAATATVAALHAGSGSYDIVDDEPAAFRGWLPFVADVTEPE